MVPGVAAEVDIVEVDDKGRFLLVRQQRAYSSKSSQSIPADTSTVRSASFSQVFEFRKLTSRASSSLPPAEKLRFSAGRLAKKEGLIIQAPELSPEGP